MSAEAKSLEAQAARPGGRKNNMNFVQYLKAYGALAAYIAITSLLGINFWQVGADVQSLWVVGALALAKMVPSVVCRDRAAAR